MYTYPSQLCCVLFTCVGQKRNPGTPFQNSNTMVLSPTAVEDEENKALLEEEDDRTSLSGWQRFDSTIVKTSQTAAWRRFARQSILILGVLALGVFAKVLIFQPTYRPHPNLSFHGSQLRSNGTHDFKRTVLMVSIDGLRYELAMSSEVKNSWLKLTVLITLTVV